MTGQPCRGAGQPSDGSGGQHRGGSGSLIGPVIIGGVIGALLLGRSHGAAEEKPSTPPTAAELLANGPKILEVRPINIYPVYGFIRDGWPIVVDYSSAPDAETVLTVAVGDRTWSRTLEPGAHQIVLRFDGGFVPDPSVALLSVESVARTARGVEPRPLDVYGIAAGPGAVGSLPIDILTFGPPVLEGGKEMATFSYRLNKRFENVSPEIIRTTKPKPGSIRSEIIWRDEIQHHQDPGLSGDRTWDGYELRSRKISHGLHSLQVRVWQQDSTEPDWGGVPSRQTVKVR